MVVEKVEKTSEVLVVGGKEEGKKGELICKYHDVKELTYKVLTKLVDEAYIIDLINKRISCSHLFGNNRWRRDG